jgi:hypothetical protein
LRWDFLTQAEPDEKLASSQRLSAVFPDKPHWHRRGIDAGTFDTLVADLVEILEWKLLE